LNESSIQLINESSVSRMAQLLLKSFVFAIPFILDLEKVQVVWWVFASERTWLSLLLNNLNVFMRQIFL